MKETSIKRLEQIREGIIGQISSNMKLYGVSETVGRVMATIYYHKHPVTLEELGEELGMTKMSMSNAVRDLISMGVAEKVRVKGSRKDHFIIEQDYYQFFIDLFCSNWRKAIYTKQSTRIKHIKELEEIIESEPDDSKIKENAEKILSESYKAIEYFNWVEQLISHFESHEIFQHVPKPSIRESE